MKLPLRRELDFNYARVEQLTPLIRRVVARNPGPFTLYGTGTYIVGRGQVAVIDPGPDLPEHVDVLASALRGETVTHLLVTHTHRDHSPACAPLARLTGARCFGYGPHGSGRRDPHAAVGGEVEAGGDLDFSPDVELRHGDVVEGKDWSLETVHTPGHTGNHLCYQLREERVLFSGDHVMGWSTSVISPPDGDMGDYLNSLELLLRRDDHMYWPTHGPRIERPRTLVRAFIRHRRLRERQVLDAIAAGCGTIAAMLPRIYTGLDPALRPAAARSLYATIIFLCRKQEICCTNGDPSLAGEYRLCRNKAGIGSAQPH